MYRKRPGTSGISNQLYETKLLTLLYFRAIIDDDFEEFQLASNIDKIGDFDICFKAKVKGYEKPVAVFILAKHKENKKTIKIDLANYFNNYMKIRHLFHPRNNDLLFRGIFDETECLFVLYTTAKVDFSDDSVGSRISDKLHYLIDTGGMVKQPYKDENNIEYLTKIVVKYQVISLAERIAKFIISNNFPMILTDEYVLRYHVILARHVFDISEIYPDGYRIASFRHEFFNTNEEHLILLKNTLLKEIFKKRKIKPADIDSSPGSIYWSTDTDYEAVEPMEIHKLLSLYFKVPAAFGNKDLTIRGSDAKIKRRINYLTTRFNDLLDIYKSIKIVTIDKSLGGGFLQLNGGIAGAVGNIFVLDDNTKLMKITDNWESLGTLAKRLYAELNREIHNLHEYRFCFKVDEFPRLSFDCCEYEEDLARDFLNKLLFYCNQADEKGVEEILKNEIEDYQYNQPNYFQVKADAIFSKYHAVIQEWWTQPRQSRSLTRETDLFRRSINKIMKDPLMSAINFTYMSKLRQYNYTFTEDAVRSLNLQNQHSNTIIVAENSELTIVKVMQHLKNRDHLVLDLEYIANLPTNDRNALRSELKNTNTEKVLILVCHKIDSNKNEKTTLEDIANTVNNSSSVSNIRTIIITNQTSLQIINRCFPKADAIIYDKKLSLFDVSEESQKSILETATAILPGVEIRLDCLLKDWPMTGPKSVGTAVASSVADKATKTGSHRIGDEEWNVPAKSQDP